MTPITADDMREAFGRLEDFRKVQPDPAAIPLMEQGVELSEEASDEFYARMVGFYTLAPDEPALSPRRAANIALIGLYAGLTAAQLAAERGS